MEQLWNVKGEKISGIIAICNLSFHFKRTQFSVILQISKQEFNHLYNYEGDSRKSIELHLISMFLLIDSYIIEIKQDI
jgi:hypothetical protein